MASNPHVILHLGLGSFHRAHQAVYLQRLIDQGDSSWVLAGGNLRPDMTETIAALQKQGGVYTLETVSPAGERHYERITSIRQIVPYEPSLAGLVALGADTLIHTAVASGAPLVSRQAERTALRVGDAVSVEIDPNALHFFDKQGRVLRPVQQAA